MSFIPWSKKSEKERDANASHEDPERELEDADNYDDSDFNNLLNSNMDCNKVQLAPTRLTCATESMEMELEFDFQQFFESDVPFVDAEEAFPIVEDVAKEIEVKDNEVDQVEAEAGDAPMDYGVSAVDPFSLPEIVSHVLRQFTNESDLKACRVFNHLWNAEACQVLRKRSFVNFKSYTIMRKYMEAMKDTDDFIHTRFSLQNLQFRFLHGCDKATMNDFLRKFGPKIKHCVLSLNRHSNADDWWTLLYNMSGLEELVVHISSEFRNPFVWSARNTLFDAATAVENVNVGLPRRMNMIEFDGGLDGVGHHIPLRYFAQNIANHPVINNAVQEQINELTPNPSPDSLKPIAPELHLQLKRISVFFHGEDGLGHSQSISSFFRTLFTACSSSLRRISCETPNTEIFLGHLLFDCLKEIDRNFINLRELNFWMKLKFNELPALCRFSTLTHLKLVVGEGIREEVFANAIIVSCPTLEKLELVIQSRTIRWKDSLPLPARMPRLKTLKVYGYRGSLGFILKTPVLRNLEIHGIGFRSLLEEMSVYKSSSDILKCLKVKGSDGFIDTVTMYKNLDCFTYLKSLELGNATDEALRLVYLSLPKLEELKLSNGSFTDMGLTGVPKVYRDDIIEHNFHVTYIISDDYEKLRQSLFIGNLSELRTLSISSNDITDVTVMLGLTRLTKLRQLTLNGKNITDHSVETMSLYMVLEALDITGCQNISEGVVSKLSQFWGISIRGPTNSVETESVDLDDPEQLLNFNHRNLNTNEIPEQQQVEQVEQLDDNVVMGFFQFP